MPGDVVAEIESVTDIDADAWDRYVRSHPDGHHVQSLAWAAYRESRGWRATRFTARRDGRLVGVAQLLSRRLGSLGNVALLDRAPLGDDDAAVDALLEAVKQAAREVPIRFLIAQAPPSAAQSLIDAGFEPSPVEVALPATTVLDVHHPDDVLFAGMKSKTRYNVRRSLRSDLTVTRGGRELVGSFHQLLESTAERQGFVPEPVGQIESMLASFGDDAIVVLVEADGQAVAGMLALAFGDTVVYKRGAWSGQAGSSNPNERLHWAGIQWARERGSTRYDFDGIDREVAVRVRDGRSLDGVEVPGVTRFKLGFGGDIVVLPEPVCYSPIGAIRRATGWMPQSLIDSRFFQSRVRRARTL